MQPTRRLHAGRRRRTVQRQRERERVCMCMHAANACSLPVDREIRLA